MAHDDDSESPPPSEPPARRVSDAWRDFLGDDAIQDVILRVVRNRILFEAPQHLVDEIVSDANVACLEANKEPEDLENPPAWVASVTVNTVRLYFRRNTKHLRWLNREANVDEVAAEEIAPPVEAVDAGSMLDSIDKWLDAVVARSPRDKETLGILRHKARTGQTDKQLVAHFKLSSEVALSSRVHYFKNKYQDRRKRYVAQRERTLAFLFKVGKWVAVALAVAGIAWWIWQNIRPRRPGRLGDPATTTPAGEEGFPVGHPPPPEDEEQGDAGR